MLDPGRYFAEAIYFLQYTLAQILWAIDRALLSIAIIAESVNAWITDNVGYFVELLVNALSAPLGGLFILALSALGCWYALNNVLPLGRWVDPGQLLTYGLVALFFFSSPIIVIDALEGLRQSLSIVADPTLIEAAAGDIFDSEMSGTDTGLPAVLPDVNSDGFIGSFDLTAAFMQVGNIDELDSNEFPVDFEATYFPFGDPSAINLGDEADQTLAKALASAGIERLFFALITIPTAIAEHFLRLALTGVAMLLYLGVPLAMLLAFFVYTSAFLGAYVKQFINLLIETLLSVIIAAIMISLLAAASQQGTGLFVAASLITQFVLLWRIKSALALATGAFDLFGGAMVTGGASSLDVVRSGQRFVGGTVGLAGAALTGGATVAAASLAGGAVLASAGALQADAQSGGAYLGLDPAKSEGRVRQLKSIAGYALGRSETVRHTIEGVHEARLLARNLSDPNNQTQTADTLDYLRAGSSLAGFGSSPWLAMRLSPSLRAAYDDIGGRGGAVTPWDTAYADEAPVAGHQRRPDPAVAQPQPDDSSPTVISDEPHIRLAPPDSQLQTVLHDSLTHLATPTTLAGQQAADLITSTAGAGNASRLQNAIDAHGSPAVIAAATAVADQTQTYRQQGVDDAAILTHFQQGDASAAIRATLETPLDESELAAVADLILLPHRQLTQAELLTIIAEQVETGETSETAVADAIGLTTDFGGQTGLIRGVINGAHALELKPDELTRLAALLRIGRRDAVYEALQRRGTSEAQIRSFVSDLNALPSSLIIPQTTSGLAPASASASAPVTPPEPNEEEA